MLYLAGEEIVATLQRVPGPTRTNPVKPPSGAAAAEAAAAAGELVVRCMHPPACIHLLSVTVCYCPLPQGVPGYDDDHAVALWRAEADAGVSVPLARPELEHPLPAPVVEEDAGK